MDTPEKDRPRRRRFTCGTQNFADLREDTRDPDLKDEAAFDGLPADEISDSEDPLAPVPRNHSTHMNSPSTPLWADPPDRRNRIASLIHSEHLYQKMLTVISFQPAAKEDPPLPVIPSGTYSDFLHRISLGLVELPPIIAMLKTRPPKGNHPTAAREAAAIAVLSRRYSTLREVTLGPSVWQISSPDSYRLLDRFGGANV